MPSFNPQTVRRHVFIAGDECYKDAEAPADHENRLALNKANRAKILAIINTLRSELNFDEMIKGVNMSNFITLKLRRLINECLLNFEARESIIESRDFGKFKKPSNVINLEEFRAS